MRLGLLHPPTRTLGAFLEETAEKALLAERLGFDEAGNGASGGIAARDGALSAER
jgi:hypothetical protein